MLPQCKSISFLFIHAHRQHSSYLFKLRTNKTNQESKSNKPPNTPSTENSLWSSFLFVTKMFSLQTESGSRPLYIDGRDEGRSNWLRYVNCARDSREENTDTFNCGGRKFYYTTKDVQPDSELLVWYGYFNYTIWNIKSSLINWKFLCWGNQQNKSGSNILVNIKFYQLSYSIHLSSKYLTFCVNHNDSSRMYVLSIDQ